MQRTHGWSTIAILLLGGSSLAEPIAISGRYPHLAMWNGDKECGTGAVVPWAGKLWVVTYAPHAPRGSDDKLYEIDANLNPTIRPESIGGTPANRMIHRESDQLFIGPYVIDAAGAVRVIPYQQALGRPTANARHLTDPANRIYLYTMEEGLYDIDVKTLAVKTIMKDGHDKGWVDPLPGYHGKGAYSAQGRLVVANNGEAKIDWHQQRFGPSGVLAESKGDGQDWNVLIRNQFTEVTGPGGIFGNAAADDPLWASGWDHRSLMLWLLDAGKWHVFRLPMADFSYNASHGWHTEWPRIRAVVPAAVGQPSKLLMNMHGGWFDFPRSFGAANTAGLRPIGSYAKVTGDFTHWNGRIVFGCDDTAVSGFTTKGHDSLNRLNGQSNSNLWFTSWQGLHQVGQPVGWGSVWANEPIKAGAPSDPYLFAGYQNRCLHLVHDADQPVEFTAEADRNGTGKWVELTRITATGPYTYFLFDDDVQAQWVRLRSSRDLSAATARFHFGVSQGAVTNAAIADSLQDVDRPVAHTTGVVRSRGGGLKTLQFLASHVDAAAQVTGSSYYDLGEDLVLTPRPNEDKARAYIEEHAVIKQSDFLIDDASVIFVEDGKRYRLPRGEDAYDRDFGPIARGIREVVTERSLFNIRGTFYILPRTHSGGVSAIKPICTHNKHIGDFCSYRGLLFMTGVKADARPDTHTIISTDGKAGLWVGDIDDLWRLGKPRGVGGPWKNTDVTAGAPSDPYLMTGFDRKTMTLAHDRDQSVTFLVEVDIDHSGQLHRYETFTVPPGKPTTHQFPTGYSAHWIRVTVDADCRATAQFSYD